MRHARLALAALLAPALAGAAELTLVVEGAPSAEGEVRAAVWSYAAGFAEFDRAAAIAAAPADPAGVTLTLEGLPEGRIAVIAWHDADGDGALDRFLGMWPTEPWAVSNAPEISGPPEFAPAAVDLPAAGATLRLRLAD
jgi:uncharacterized protein (DUF2141 family)